MDNPARLVVGQNDKLGKRVGNFNLPRLETCPGATDACKAVCYGRFGNFLFKSFRERARLNYEGAGRSDFAEAMVPQCRHAAVARLHSLGDFFSPAYVSAWTSIAEACPDTVFCAYTRSWRVDGFEGELRRFSALARVQLFLSVEDGDEAPDGFRLAYMHETWQRPANSFRCPHQLQHERHSERRVKDCVSCGACRLCYRAPGKYRDVEFRVHRGGKSR